MNTLYHRIAYGATNKSKRLCDKYGLNVKFKDTNELAKGLKFLTDKVEEAKIDLIHIHPDYDIITSADKLNAEGEGPPNTNTVFGIQRQDLKNMSIGAAVIIGVLVLSKALK